MAKKRTKKEEIKEAPEVVASQEQEAIIETDPGDEVAELEGEDIGEDIGQPEEPVQEDPLPDVTQQEEVGEYIEEKCFEKERQEVLDAIEASINKAKEWDSQDARIFSTHTIRLLSNVADYVKGVDA